MSVSYQLDDKKKISENIKFDNNILHRSKVLKYFLSENYSKEKVEKDLISIHKKIKKNKDYFYSIKDIILLEALIDDGINIPKGLDMSQLSLNLTIPDQLTYLSESGQSGLVLLKIIEMEAILN